MFRPFRARDRGDSRDPGRRFAASPLRSALADLFGPLRSEAVVGQIKGAISIGTGRSHALPEQGKPGKCTLRQGAWVRRER